jgi:Ca2+-binding RTX toxin-like protein
MATIYGKQSFSPYSGYSDNYADVLVGDGGADMIYGLSGDDQLWGNAGLPELVSG